jgi:hypothetical protein
VRVTGGAHSLGVRWRRSVATLATYCDCVTQANVGHAGNLCISLSTVELTGAAEESRSKDFPSLYRAARGRAAANADGEISKGP